jgi:hypothetical protein
LNIDFSVDIPFLKPNFSGTDMLLVCVRIEPVTHNFTVKRETGV